MAILTVYTKLLDKTLEGARIIDMGSTKSCECFVLPRDSVAEVAKNYIIENSKEVTKPKLSADKENEMELL